MSQLVQLMVSSLYQVRKGIREQLQHANGPDVPYFANPTYQQYELTEHQEITTCTKLSSCAVSFTTVKQCSVLLSGLTTRPSASLLIDLLVIALLYLQLHCTLA